MSSKKRAYSKLCEQQFFLEYHYWEMRKMTTFLIGLAILIIGGFLYGSFVERIFKPDDRQTPAVKLEDQFRVSYLDRLHSLRFLLDASSVEQFMII